MIEVKNLFFRYQNDIPVLEDISFTLERSESLCLLGPNGTGKTTLFRCLLCLQKPQRGKVLIDGKEINCLSPRQRAQSIAYVPQSSGLTFPYTVMEAVLMGRVAHRPLGASVSRDDRIAAEAALERLNVQRLKNCRFHELSGGERQLVLVARALAQQTTFLVLDEPTASLDYANQINILQVIKRLAGEGYAVLMTSHSPNQAFLAATRALLLKDGRVFADGTPAEAVNSANLTALYGLPVCVTDAEAAFGEDNHIVRVCIPSMS